MDNSMGPPAEMFVIARSLNPNYRRLLDSPDWESADITRDWRRFVDPGIRDLWPRMYDEAKLAVFINAEQTRRAFGARKHRNKRR